MKPEEKAELILWDWLKTKGSFVKEVYFNRINNLNAPTFTTSGLNKKPDFIIKIDRGYGIEFCAIEIKDSSSNRNIHDAGKILYYYKNYTKGKTKYLINAEEIKINHFVIATENSHLGFLFKDEKDKFDNSNCNTDTWRRTKAKFKTEPKEEYKLSSMFLRGIWANFRFFRKENEEFEAEEKPSLGIIISNFAENDFSPYLFIMNYNKHLTKPKWGARWWKI